MYRICRYKRWGSCKGAWGRLGVERKGYEKSNVRKTEQKSAIQNKNLSNFFRAT